MTWNFRLCCCRIHKANMWMVINDESLSIYLFIILIVADSAVSSVNNYLKSWHINSNQHPTDVGILHYVIEFTGLWKCEALPLSSHWTALYVQLCIPAVRSTVLLRRHFTAIHPQHCLLATHKHIVDYYYPLYGQWSWALLLACLPVWCFYTTVIPPSLNIQLFSSTYPTVMCISK